MCAADVLSLLFSKNFTLRLSGGFDHDLVASNNVEICVISREVFMDNCISFRGKSVWVHRPSRTFFFWLKVELKIKFLSEENGDSD